MMIVNLKVTGYRERLFNLIKRIYLEKNNNSAD